MEKHIIYGILCGIAGLISMLSRTLEKKYKRFLYSKDIAFSLPTYQLCIYLFGKWVLYSLFLFIPYMFVIIICFSHENIDALLKYFIFIPCILGFIKPYFLYKKYRKHLLTLRISEVTTQV